MKINGCRPILKSTSRPWPTKNAMEQVYEQHLWGGEGYDFYSGFGSHLPELVEPYIKVVIAFLKSFEQPLSICDLGCGDFNIGARLVDFSEKYFAIDIAENVIERNREKFSGSGLEFHCLDIAKDELPAADCVILRHVLQHISNAEIHQVVEKLNAYKYVLLTEHLPHDLFVPNLDIISGQGTRLKKKSGVDLLASPFNLKVKSQEELLSLSDQYGIVVTTLYEMF